MPASPERIRQVIERYVELVAHGTADQVVDLYADGATVEDPVGSEVRTTRESIREFYGGLEGLEQEARVLAARAVPGEAAFWFELVTNAGEQTYTIAPIDVMTFDDDAKITSMRAFWSDADVRIS